MLAEAERQDRERKNALEMQRRFELERKLVTEENKNMTRVTEEVQRMKTDIKPTDPNNRPVSL